MSTILDALKRSEQERKLNAVPTLSDMPAPRERAKWPLVLAFIITILLLAVIAWMLIFNEAQSPIVEESVVTRDSMTDETVAEVTADSGLMNISVISYADEPSARFVMVNDKLFREGEFVMAGIKIESIQLDSVILIERGKRVTRKL